VVVGVPGEIRKPKDPPPVDPHDSFDAVDPAIWI
jgi:hypothetical protein